MAFVFYGSSTGLSCGLGCPVDPISDADWFAEVDNPGALFGLSVDGARDFNGDGYIDVIIGASDYSNGQQREGAAFVYYGETFTPSPTHTSSPTHTPTATATETHVPTDTPTPTATHPPEVTATPTLVVTGVELVEFNGQNNSSIAVIVTGLVLLGLFIGIYFLSYKPKQ